MKDAIPASLTLWCLLAPCVELRRPTALRCALLGSRTVDASKLGQKNPFCFSPMYHCLGQLECSGHRACFTVHQHTLPAWRCGSGLGRAMPRQPALRMNSSIRNVRHHRWHHPNCNFSSTCARALDKHPSHSLIHKLHLHLLRTLQNNSQTPNFWAIHTLENRQCCFQPPSPALP